MGLDEKIVQYDSWLPMYRAHAARLHRDFAEALDAATKARAPEPLGPGDFREPGDRLIETFGPSSFDKDPK